MAPATRKATLSSHRPISSRPTVQLPSTNISVRLGPMRSQAIPQKKLAMMATTISPISTNRASPWLKPTALMANRLITAMAVLIGSV